MTMSASAARSEPARAKLLRAAARLFYQYGMTATGIDAIIAEAGVAKKSLYNNFSSKEELMQAYLKERDEEWMDLYTARVRQAATAKQRVLAVFDAYIDHAEAADAYGFRGCGLLNAAAEFPATADGRAIVRAHKERVEQIMAEHLAEIVPAGEAAELAGHLSFLLEGAMSRAGLEGGPERIHQARKLAEALLRRGSLPSELAGGAAAQTDDLGAGEAADLAGEQPAAAVGEQLIMDRDAELRCAEVPDELHMLLHRGPGSHQRQCQHIHTRRGCIERIAGVEEGGL